MSQSQTTRDGRASDQGSHPPESAREADRRAVIRGAHPPAPVGGPPLTSPVLERRLLDLADELAEAEAECAALWDENEALKTEGVNLRSAHEQTQHLLDRVHHELEQARHVIGVMEATRGWRLLLFFRRCRDTVLRRGPISNRAQLERLVASYETLNAEQKRVFRDQAGL